MERIYNTFLQHETCKCKTSKTHLQTQISITRSAAQPSDTQVLPRLYSQNYICEHKTRTTKFANTQLAKQTVQTQIPLNQISNHTICERDLRWTTFANKRNPQHGLNKNKNQFGTQHLQTTECGTQDLQAHNSQTN